MQLTALVFPATALRQSLLFGLAPLFKPVQVLQPPSLGEDAQAAPPGLQELVRVLRPAGGADQAQMPQAQEAARLLRSWEQWLHDHRGSGEAEAIKAGVEPPAPPETFRSLVGQIKNYQGADQKGGPGLPQVEADLFLHLAHIQDQEASGLEQALAQAKQSEQKLSSSMGRDLDDHQPADYEGHIMDRLAPVDYSLPQERLLEQRLKAWATLAAESGGGEAWLAAASGEAARLLLERAQALVQPPAIEIRSPAGAVSPLGLAPMSPRPDNPLAQEAARLVLPDLSGLDEEMFINLAQGLDDDPKMALLRQRINHLAQRLRDEKWWAGLASELAQEAQELAEGYTELIKASGISAGPKPRALSLLAFPGLGRSDILALMRGEEPAGAPRLKDWPDNWPDGCCPMWVLW
jgi:hypothetical protein